MKLVNSLMNLSFMNKMHSYIPTCWMMHADIVLDSCSWPMGGNSAIKAERTPAQTSAARVRNGTFASLFVLLDAVKLAIVTRRSRNTIDKQCTKVLVLTEGFFNR